MAAAAASRSHATTDGKISQRNVENPILSSMIYEGGLQPHAGIIQSWVDSIRGPLYGISEDNIAFVQDYFNAKTEAERQLELMQDPLDHIPGFKHTGVLPPEVPMTIPKVEYRILCGTMEKRNQDNHWHPRHVILSPTEITIAEGSFAPSTSTGQTVNQTICRTGYVRKKAQTMTTFRTHFFVLLGNGIVWYYLDEKHYLTSKPRGSFSCSGLTILEQGHSREGYLFTLTMRRKLGVKKIVCACEHEAERDAWVDALREAQRLKEHGSSAAEQAEESADGAMVVKAVIPLPHVFNVRVLKSDPHEDILHLQPSLTPPISNPVDLAPTAGADQELEGEGAGLWNVMPNARLRLHNAQGAPASSSAAEGRASPGWGDAAEGRASPGWGRSPSPHASALSRAGSGLYTLPALNKAGSGLYTLEVHTRVDGYESVVFLRSTDVELLCDFTVEIDCYARVCAHIHAWQTKSKFQRYQEALRAWYGSNPVQIVVAILIIVNFLANVAQTEMLPAKASAADLIFEKMDLFFTYTFTVELAVNLAANLFWPFVTDGWAVFDFIVVAVSLVSLGVGDVPGMSTLRLMRAFRVMRLFGRLESLRQIITALTASLIPVSNALLIMLLITSIYSILAVNFYAGRSQEFFGSFSKALFSLFQICTCDSWASEITRSILIGGEDQGKEPLDKPTALFFMSFVVIVSWTLLNVVVAVLLDNFTQAANAEKELKAAVLAKQQGQTPVRYSIDPLLSALSHFDTSADLSHRIHLLFRVLDDKANGSLTFDELRAGLMKFRISPPILVSRDDWDAMTENRRLTDGVDELSLDVFEMIMRKQMKLYVQRKLCNALQDLGPEPGQIGAINFAIKLLLIAVDVCNDQMKALNKQILLRCGHKEPTEDESCEGIGNHVIPVFRQGQGTNVGQQAASRSDGLQAAASNLSKDLKKILHALQGHPSPQENSNETRSAFSVVVRDTEPHCELPLLSLNAPAITSNLYAQAQTQNSDDKKNELPPGWTQLWSKTKNRPYYRHEETGKSSWILPITV